MQNKIDINLSAQNSTEGRKRKENKYNFDYVAKVFHL